LKYPPRPRQPGNEGRVASSGRGIPRSAASPAARDRPAFRDGALLFPGPSRARCVPRAPHLSVREPPLSPSLGSPSSPANRPAGLAPGPPGISSARKSFPERKSAGQKKWVWYVFSFRPYPAKLSLDLAGGERKGRHGQTR